MRKHHSSTTTHYDIARRKARELKEARIEAAVCEYAEILMDIDNFDFNEVDERIASARQGGLPPRPKWQERVRKEREQRKEG